MPTQLSTDGLDFGEDEDKVIPEAKPLVEDKKEAAATTATTTDDTTVVEEKKEVVVEDKKPDDDKKKDSSTEDLIDSTLDETEKEVEAKKKPVVDDAAKKKEAEDLKKKEDEAKKTSDTKEATDDEVTKALGPHASPRSKASFNAIKAERETARKEAATAKEELTKLQEEVKALKSQGPSKETSDQLEMYKSRLREIDVANDPEIQTKYDGKAKSNEDEIINILKGVVEESKLPALEQLRKAGVNSANLGKTLENMKSSRDPDFVDAAKDIEGLLSENRRLAKEKAKEITNLKSTYEQREAAKKQQAELANQATVKKYQDITSSKIANLVKENPHIKTLKIEDSDSTEEKARKKEHNDFVASLETTILTDMKKIGEGDAEVTIDTILRAGMLKDRERQLNEERKRVAELEGELVKYKKAGQVSKKNSPPVDSTKKERDVSKLSAEDILFPDDES